MPLRSDKTDSHVAEINGKTDFPSPALPTGNDSGLQQRLYSTILSSTPDLAYVFDLDSRLIYANEKLLTILGLSWDEACGKTVLELGLDPSEVKRCESEMERVIATKEPIRGEVPFSGTDGKRFYDYILVPVIGTDETVEAVAGTARDVTERVAEQSRTALLLKIGEFVRTISDPAELLYSVSAEVGEHFNLKRCLFSEIDLNGDAAVVHRDYANGVPSASGKHRVSDYSPLTFEEMADGQTVVNRDSSVDERTAELYKDIYGPRRDRSYVAVPLMRNGRCAASMYCSDSKPRQWTEAEIAVLQIIAERAWFALEKLRSEEALRESRERFSIAFNSSPLAITITSLATGKLVEVNDTFIKMTGYSRSEAIGRSTEELGLWLNRSDREAELAAVQRETRIRDMEYTFRMRDGSEVIGLLSAELIDIGGEPCSLTVIQDITARVKAEKAMHEAAAQYGDLLESIDEGFCVLELLYDSKGLVHDYRFVETSPSFDKQSGLTGVQGKTVREIAPDEAGYWIDLVAGAASGRPVRTEKFVESTSRWLDVYVFRVGDGHRGHVAMLFKDISTRKRTESALRESENRFRLVANVAPVLIWNASVTGERNWFNRCWLDFTGKTLEQEEGAAWQEGLHPEDRQRYLGEYERALNSQEEFETEFRLRRYDGEYRWMLDRGVPRLEDDGHFRGYIGSCTDITDRKAAEESLRASKAEIETVFTMTPFMFTHCSRDLRYKYVSRSYAEMFGRDPEDFVDVEIVEIIGEKAFENIRPWIEKVLAGNSVEYETYLDLKTGRRCLSVSYVPVRDSHGEVSGWIGSINDITDRKKAEGLLDRYRLLSEESTDVIWFARPDGSFVDVNRAAVETYGYSREEFLRMKLSDVRHPDTLGELPLQLDRANRKGIYFQTMHVRKDGTAFPVEVKANGGDFGGERLVMSIVRDISDRRKAESELLESEERRQMAQEAGNVGIWDWDVVAGRTYWSETMWTFYGERPSGINPDEEFWTSHLHPNDRERVKANLNAVVESGEDQFRDEFRIVRSDGSIRWIEAKARVSRDENGKATRVCGVNLDITERKEAEERVRLSEYQLRVVTNAVPALISYVDSRERYRFVNHKYIEWFGKRPDELIGKKVKDTVGAAAYREMKPRIDEALAGVESTFETVLNYKNAGTRYVHISFVPDIGIDGIVHGYYGLTHDLTDLKRSEDLLRSSEERMGMLMESFTDYAIFSTDSEGKVDSWNKGAEIIFGYTQDEIMGLSADLIFTPEDIKHGIPEKERKTARKKGRASDERWHIRKDGSRFFASGVLMPLYVGKRLSGFAKIASDLTERKRRAEELQRAHDELELRVKERTKELAESNLALVKEMEEREVAEHQRIDLLRRLVSSQEFERRRIARDLHDQLGQRLTALRLKIASLMDSASAHPQFGNRVQRLQEIAEKLDSEVSFLAWELRPSALDDLGLGDAIGAFVNEWSKHYEVPADFYSANPSADRLNRDVETHLYRITQEALNNIAKHAQATQVTVILERRAGDMILIIEDNGTGFDPRKMDKGPSESGKGLGLVGMRERASIVGGSVEIESAPGKGTTIYVKVPFSV